MGHEFNEAEMYPCEICGETYPIEEMYQLEDGRIVCGRCLDEINAEQ